MLTGTNLKYTKAYNYRIVLETIRLFGPLSRADVARRTSLTAQTVSNITRQLIDAALIQEVDKRRRGRGAPSITLDINPEGAYSIGLDLDRDHLTGVLVDLSGTVLQRVHYELNFPSPARALDLMADAVERFTTGEDIVSERLSGIGVGFPGPIEITNGNVVTNVVNPKAFPGWQRVPVIDLLAERIDLPIFLENNATAAAVGERWYGAGQHLSHFFYLFFGIGLGGGLIIDGRPYEGHSGNAAELGYLPLFDNKRVDNGQASSHVGEYFHLPHLYEALREQGHTASEPSDLLPLFEAENDILMEWLDAAMHPLAYTLLAVEYLIDPEVIFFGGRLPGPLLDAMLNRLQETLPTLRIRGKSKGPTLQRATAGEDAAALGVATLPIYDYFAPIPRLLMKRNGEQEDTPLARRLFS